MAIDLASMLFGQQTTGPEDPNKAAMSALAAQLLMGSAPSPYRTGFGAQLGAGLQAGHAAKSQALQDAQKGEFMKAQIQAMLARANGEGAQGVQSTVIGEDGYFYTVDRGTGKATSTGVKAAPNMRVIEQEGNVPFGVVTGRGQAGQVVPLGGAAPATVPSGPRVGPVRIPTAGDRARDEAQAKADVELATRPTITRETEMAKIDAERTTAAPERLADIQKMRRNIEGLIGSPGFSTIYGKSRYASPSMLPGGEGANSDARREQLEAQAFGESIQKMKGLGALSNAEGSKVSAAYSRATNPKISEEEARDAWGEVLEHLTLAEERIRTGVRVDGASASGGGPKKIASDADYDALPSGAEFIDPEGVRRRKP